MTDDSPINQYSSGTNWEFPLSAMGSPVRNDQNLGPDFGWHLTLIQALVVAGALPGFHCMPLSPHLQSGQHRDVACRTSEPVFVIR